MRNTIIFKPLKPYLRISGHKTIWTSSIFNFKLAIRNINNSIVFFKIFSCFIVKSYYRTTRNTWSYFFCCFFCNNTPITIRSITNITNFYLTFRNKRINRSYFYHFYWHIFHINTHMHLSLILLSRLRF